MNPRERFLTTLRGGRADRVPLHLLGFHARSRDVIDRHPDPLWREIAHRVYDETFATIVCPSYVNRYMVTPPQRIHEVQREEREGQVIITSEIDTPKGPLIAVTGRDEASQTTWTIKYPVETLDDVDRLRSVPWELPSDLEPPTSSQLPPDFDRRGVLGGHVSSPFVCVAGAMPYQTFLELCVTDLPLIEELTEQCLERILDVLAVLLSGRPLDYVWMGGCEWLTPPMGSPKLYERLVQPFEAQIISRVHSAGAFAHIHCHGRVRSTLELAIARGGDYFEPLEPPPDGDITFTEAKERVAGRITLGGNIESRILQMEEPQVVETACRAAFSGSKERMVLQPSAGPYRQLTPRMLENYHRMIDVWEELSPF
jgi:hypothetical protein